MRRFLGALPTVLFLSASAWAQAPTTYPDTGSPTNQEQLMLEMINRARANPSAEGARLALVGPPIGPLPGGDITEGLANPTWVLPRPPLAMNVQLLTTARLHSEDMWTNAYFSHTGTGGTTPTNRANAQGYSAGVAENIAAGTGFTIVDHQNDLTIDMGVAGRGHRVNILDVIGPGSLPKREVGIGWYFGATPAPFPPAGPTGDLQNFMTQNFGRRNSVGPFLLGVVYNDSNSSAFYDLGEGIGSVTINTVDGTMAVTGTWQGVTGSAGGYSFPVGTSGTVNVKPTAGIAWAATVYKKVTLTGENIKVDFRLSEGVDTDQDGMPDAWETANGFTPNGVPGNLTEANGDLDSDTFSNVEEFRFGSNPGSAASTPSNPSGGGGPPPPSGGDSDGGSGGCGLTGLGVLLPLLLRLRRR